MCDTPLNRDGRGSNSLKKILVGASHLSGCFWLFVPKFLGDGGDL